MTPSAPAAPQDDSSRPLRARQRTAACYVPEPAPLSPPGGTDWASVIAAVPAAVTEAAGWTAARRIREAERCADLIASAGDVLRAAPAAAGRAEVTPSQVTSAVVTGLAILACRRGGVGFMGAHWHAGRSPCLACPGPGTLPLFGLPPAPAAPGVVFTPRPLADDVAVNALAAVTGQLPAADIRALRVCDPFCGTGAFLLAAARYLGATLAAAWISDGDEAEPANLCTLYGTTDPVMAARGMVIAHCISGADLDPVSVELAGLALQLLAPECGTDHVLDVDDGEYEWYVGAPLPGYQAGQHARLLRPPGPPSARLPGLRAGDSLAGRPAGDGSAGLNAAAVHWPEAFPEVFASGGFDAVIGNPPFLGGLKIPGALGRHYREYLVTAVAGGRRTTADLAVYCWLRMHQLTRPHGVVGIVGPDALIREAGDNAKFADDLRDKHGWQVYRKVTNLKWPARSAAVRICTVWTCQRFGADPPELIRNVFETPPPATIWQHVRTVDADGTPLRVYERRPPARPRSRPRRAAARRERG